MEKTKWLKNFKSINPNRCDWVIYESRPNVTSDVASLCLKSGNSVILKGGSEAFIQILFFQIFRKFEKERSRRTFVQFIK